MIIADPAAYVEQVKSRNVTELFSQEANDILGLRPGKEVDLFSSLKRRHRVYGDVVCLVIGVEFGLHVLAHVFVPLFSTDWCTQTLLDFSGVALRL